MTRLPVLILANPGGALTSAYVGDSPAVRAATRRLAGTWGRTRTIADRRRRALVCVDGRVAYLRYAHVIEANPTYAVLNTQNHEPDEVYLAADKHSASFMAANIAGAAYLTLGRAADLAPGSPLALVALSFGPTPDTGQPRGDTLCPRCGEQRLHLQPVFDARSHRDGSRICNPCGMIEVIKEQEARRGRATGGRP